MCFFNEIWEMFLQFGKVLMEDFFFGENIGLEFFVRKMGDYVVCDMGCYGVVVKGSFVVVYFYVVVNLFVDDDGVNGEIIIEGFG